MCMQYLASDVGLITCIVFRHCDVIWQTATENHRRKTQRRKQTHRQTERQIDREVENRLTEIVVPCGVDVGMHGNVMLRKSYKRIGGKLNHNRNISYMVLKETVGLLISPKKQKNVHAVFNLASDVIIVFRHCHVIWQTATKNHERKTETETDTQTDRETDSRGGGESTDRDSCSMRSWCRCARQDKNGRW